MTLQILVSIGPVVEEKSCHKLNMNDKEKRSIKTDLKHLYSCETWRPLYMSRETSESSLSFTVRVRSNSSL